MRSIAIIALAGGLLLSACKPTNVNQPVNVQALALNNKAARCIPGSDMGVYASGNEMTGDLRARLLTPEAQAAGVRIFRKESDITNYGSQTLFYANSTATCILWMESITLQEFGQRLGLDPLVISPFYEAPKPVTPAPTPVPTEKVN